MQVQRNINIYSGWDCVCYISLIVDHNLCYIANVHLVCSRLLCYKVSLVLQYSTIKMVQCRHRIACLGSSSRQYFESADQNLRYDFAWNICELKIQLFRRPIVSWFWLCRRHIYCHVHKRMQVQRDYNITNLDARNHVLNPYFIANHNICDSTNVH